MADHERRSALLDLLSQGRLADRHALSLLASGLRLPAECPYLAIVTEAPEAGVNPMPDIEVQLRAHGHASAWQLLPDALVGIVHLPNRRADALNTRLARYPNHHHGLSPAFADLALASSALRMARIALAGTRATGEHIGILDDQPVIMAAASDPDVMRHIRHTVLRGLDAMPEDERAVLPGHARDLAGHRRFLRRRSRCALLPPQHDPPPATPPRHCDRPPTAHPARHRRPLPRARRGARLITLTVTARGS